MGRATRLGPRQRVKLPSCGSGSPFLHFVLCSKKNIKAHVTYRVAGMERRRTVSLWDESRIWDSGDPVFE